MRVKFRYKIVKCTRCGRMRFLSEGKRVGKCTRCGSTACTITYVGM